MSAWLTDVIHPAGVSRSIPHDARIDHRGERRQWSWVRSATLSAWTPLPVFSSSRTAFHHSQPKCYGVASDHQINRQWSERPRSICRRLEAPRGERLWPCRSMDRLRA